MQPIRIVLMCIFAACIYGILHDQITARICVEYFTIGHPPIFNTEDPTLLGLGWGILATWWVGLLLGVPLAMAARIGPRPKRTAGTLIRPVVYLLGVMAVCAFLAGIVGWILASTGAIFLVGPMAIEISEDRHVPFLIDLWAHLASYIVGLAGGLVVIVQVWRSRGRVA
jgi:hypothetical protein